MSQGSLTLGVTYPDQHHSSKGYYRRAIKALADQGKSLEDIAAEFRTSVGDVARALAK